MSFVAQYSPTVHMKTPYLLFWNIIGLLALSLVFGSCQRAGYVFQPSTGSQPTTKFASLTVSPALGLAVVAIKLPALDKKRYKAPFVRTRPAVHVKAAMVDAKPAGRALESLRPVARQQLKAQMPNVARQNEPNPPERYRSRGIALLLALVPFFFGIFGLHRFYLGYAGRGVAYLLGGLLTVFLVFLGALGLFFGGSGLTVFFTAGALVGAVLLGLQFSDIVQIITGGLKPKNGEYNLGFFQTKPSIKVSVPEQK